MSRGAGRQNRAERRERRLHSRREGCHDRQHRVLAVRHGGGKDDRTRADDAALEVVEELTAKVRPGTSGSDLVDPVEEERDPSVRLGGLLGIDEDPHGGRLVPQGVAGQVGHPVEREVVFNFVQFYEMHTNDIIMVTSSNAHMQIKIQIYVQI